VCVVVLEGIVCERRVARECESESNPREIARVCLFITAGPSTKLFTWGGGDMGGHVLRESTSRGLCGLGCPSRTSERGGEGDCVKGGGGEEGKCERERALELLRYYTCACVFVYYCRT
jgi:hypothetical protein